MTNSVEHENPASALQRWASALHPDHGQRALQSEGTPDPSRVRFDDEGTESLLLERIRLSPSPAVWILSLAYWRLSQGQPDQALQEALKASLHGDAEVKSHAAMCCALAADRLGLHDMVIGYLARPALHHAMPIRFRMLLGDAYCAMGQWMEAVNCYDEVLEMQPRRFDVHRRKLRALWLHAIGQLRLR